jgi:long-chain acyl-CoA synthetase
LPNGALKIIDRKKHIFKLSQGEYIAPEKLENTFVQNIMFKNIFVYGDSLQDYIVAIVVPEEEQVKKWSHSEGLQIDDYDEFIQSEEFKKRILDILNDFKASAGLNSLEIPKKVCIHKEEFTVESGLLTPTFKLKRIEAKQMFMDDIKKMYGGAIFQGEN